jgi:hypothetical protein
MRTVYLRPTVVHGPTGDYNSRRWTTTVEQIPSTNDSPSVGVDDSELSARLTTVLRASTDPRVAAVAFVIAQSAKGEPSQVAVDRDVMEAVAATLTASHDDELRLVGYALASQAKSMAETDPASELTAQEVTDILNGVDDSAYRPDIRSQLPLWTEPPVEFGASLEWENYLGQVVDGTFKETSRFPAEALRDVRFVAVAGLTNAEDHVRYGIRVCMGVSIKSIRELSDTVIFEVDLSTSHRNNSFVQAVSDFEASVWGGVHNSRTDIDGNSNARIFYGTEA